MKQEEFFKEVVKSNKYRKKQKSDMKKLTKTVIYAIFIGSVLTLMSLINTLGFFGNLSNLGTNYGFPFFWLNVVWQACFGCPIGTGTGFSSYSIIWQSFFIDFIFWLVVSFAILSFYFRRKK